MLEQHTRLNNVRVLGVKEEANESTSEVICAKNKLGVQINPSEFDCKRVSLVPSSSGNQNAGVQQQRGPRPIFVQFINHLTRSRFMAARSKLKGTGVYINEDLTKANQKLLFLTRHNSKVTRAWSIDGRIFAGIENSGGGLTRKLITCEEDIAKL